MRKASLEQGRRRRERSIADRYIGKTFAGHRIRS